MAGLTKMFEGLSVGQVTPKTLFMIGGSGAVLIGFSDYWCDKWFQPATGQTFTAEQELSAKRKRAAAQLALGLGVAFILKKSARNVAVGAAFGGFFGAARRLWVSENMAQKVTNLFAGSSSSSSSSSTTPPTQEQRAALGYAPAAGRFGAGAVDARTIFTGPSRFARMVS